MALKKKDFEVDKLLLSVIAINSAENYLYNIGLSLFSFGSQTRNRFLNSFFISLIICVSKLNSINAVLMKEDKCKLLLIRDNPFFISYIISVQILNSITAILMNEDKYRLLLIGDFAYFIKDRYVINFAIILSYNRVLWLFRHKFFNIGSTIRTKVHNI
jgi:predicted nucleic acid-binding protein